MTEETEEARSQRWSSMLDRVYAEILEMHHHREIWQFTAGSK